MVLQCVYVPDREVPLPAAAGSQTIRLEPLKDRGIAPRSGSSGRHNLASSPPSMTKQDPVTKDDRGETR